MKKTIIAALLLLGAATGHSKIWRVNNNVGMQADFNDPNSAFAAAAAGDTVHIEASATGFNSSIVLNKRLVVRGPGYFFADATPNPKTQHIRNQAYLSTFTAGPGSKGAVVEGLDLGYVYINDSLVTLQRSFIGGGLYLSINAAHGDTIRHNYINGSIYNNSGNATGLFIYNNIINGSISLGAGTANFDGYVINNSFVNNNGNFVCQNFIFQNNIFSVANFGNYRPSNIFYNNIAGNADLPAGNGNQINIPMTDVYEGWTSGTGFSSDGRYKLKAGSPAIGAGTMNGSAVDCGAFGGPAPYVLSGLPAMPAIYNISMPAQVNAGTSTVNITVSAAAH